MKLKLKFNTRLILGFGIILTIMLGLVFYNYLQLNKIMGLQTESQKRGQDAVVLEEIVGMPNQMYSVFADLIINQEFENNRQEWDEIVQEMEADLLLAKKLVDTDQENKLLSEAEQVAASFVSAYEQTIPLIKSNNVEAITAIDGEVDDYKIKFGSTVRKISDSLNDEMEEANLVFQSTIGNI